MHRRYGLLILLSAMVVAATAYVGWANFFPLRARDHLLGVLVIGPRPGEHYAAEERELIAHVAHAVGSSLFALRARETEEQLTTTRAEAAASAARESLLLEALRALGAEPRASAQR